MPYDQNLTERIRFALQVHPGFVEKKMFGGVGFMLRGNMVCGVQGDDMIVRVGEENNEAALSQPFVRQFTVMQGKPMAGWIVVAPDGTATDQELREWIEKGYAYTSALPEK